MLANMSNRPLHSWFGAYTRHYLSDGQENRNPVVVKIVHCQRVRREMVQLANALQLNERLISLAEIIGLFHDIGRFEQFRRYHTFVDQVSVNHAELAVEILQKERILDGLDGEDKELVLQAILFHNRAELPREIAGEHLLLAKMIRDADKLDIWRVFIEHSRWQGKSCNRTIDLDLPDTLGVSDGTYADIMTRRIVKYRHVKNQNDFCLMRLGWVFDINFSHSFQEIHRRDYLSEQKKHLPRDDRANELFAFVEAYIAEKIDCAYSLPSKSPELHLRLSV